MTLFLDYESKSRVNLLTDGAYKYATHPSTEVICMGWAIDSDDTELWWPGEPFPEAVANVFAAGKPRSIHAHNAAFERLITWYVLCPDYDIPEPPLEAFYCTASQARARALPGGLDNLGVCLQLRVQKDRRGKELIKLLCVPQADGTFNTDPTLMEEFGDYCRRDVDVERLAAQMTPPLTDIEFRDYVVSEKINDRGLLIDRSLAIAATRYAEAEREEICGEIDLLTEGDIKTPQQYARLKDYMAPLMEANDKIRKIMTIVRTDRRSGEETRKISLGRPVREQLLSLEEIEPGTFDEDTLYLLELLDDAARSSVAKYRNMNARADDLDDRVRGAYIYAGASQTKRFSSVGLQMHNLVRKTDKEPLVTRDNMLNGVAFPVGTVMDRLSAMLRPSIMAPDGMSFVCGDWSAIEARVLPWLSNDPDANEVLSIFRACDADPELPDLYMREAGVFFNIAATEVDPDQRQVGKVEVLSLGFGGGSKAFMAMGRGYGVHVEEGQAEQIKTTWRSNNPWAQRFWHKLESSAIQAVRNPGQLFEAGRVSYCQPDERAPLYCQLPDGTVLSYPRPEVRIEDQGYGPKPILSAIKAAWTPKQGETEWPRVDLWGGMHAENITQGFSAAILREFLHQSDVNDWPTVGHTHDEGLWEVFDDEVDEGVAALKDIMEDVPVWAPGLPLKAEIWTGKRYRK